MKLLLKVGILGILLFIVLIFLFWRLSHEHFCYKLSNSRQLCLALANRELMRCGNVTSGSQDLCKLLLALKLGEEACQNISNEYLDLCHAYGKKVPLECEKIENWNLRSECYYTLGLFLNNSNICERIHENFTFDAYESVIKKNTCMALLTLDRNYCDKMTVLSPERDDCYALLAFRTNNETFCGSVLRKATRKTCKALLENNLTECDNIEGCKVAFAVWTRNPTICNLLSSGLQKERCNFFLAINSGNIMPVEWSLKEILRQI